MNKELYELINKIRRCVLNGQSLLLSKSELRLVLRYINQLEKEVAGEE